MSVLYDKTMPPKDPDDVLDYTRDWRSDPWLEATDNIATSTWFIHNDTGELVIDSDTNDQDSATVWLSGGVAGSDYIVTNRIVTDDGREADRSFRVQVREL